MDEYSCAFNRFGSIFLLYKFSCNKRTVVLSEQLRVWMPYIVAILAVGIYVVGVIWVINCHVYPRGDGLSLCHAAHRMVTGNFVGMKERGYLFIFPHQFSLLSVIHAIFTWFGAMNYQVFQHINAACMPLLFYSGYKIIKLICDKMGAVICYILFFIACLPLFFYVPYVYGEVISITFTMVLMWQVIRFCKTGKKSALLWGVLAVVIACYVRNNSLVVLIAVGIVMVIHSLKNANFKGFIWILVMSLMIFGSQYMVRAYYEKVSGIEVAEGAGVSIPI